jgi:hypothetical protein
MLLTYIIDTDGVLTNLGRNYTEEVLLPYRRSAIINVMSQTTSSDTYRSLFLV